MGWGPERAGSARRAPVASLGSQVIHLSTNGPQECRRCRACAHPACLGKRLPGHGQPRQHPTPPSSTSHTTIPHNSHTTITYHHPPAPHPHQHPSTLACGQHQRPHPAPPQTARPLPAQTARAPRRTCCVASSCCCSQCLLSAASCAATCLACCLATCSGRGGLGVRGGGQHWMHCLACCLAACSPCGGLGVGVGWLRITGYRCGCGCVRG